MKDRVALVALLLMSFAACRDTLDTGPQDPNAAMNSHGTSSILSVGFNEALRIRVDPQGRLRSAVGANVTAMQAALDGLGILQIEPLFDIPADRLEAMYSDYRRLSGGEPADLLSWHRIRLPAGLDAATAINLLSKRPEIAYVYLAPLLNPPPPVTPDFSANQSNYFGPAPSGTENVYARGLPGGRGAGIKLVDIEYDWNFDHEDLTLPPSTLIGGTRDPTFGNDHGTAVLGEIVGRDNGFGIIGGAPDVTIRVEAVNFGGQRKVSQAVGQASAQMVAGDVILIEQQEDMDGNPATPNDLVPVEWNQETFVAISTATGAGRIVVEAAGNGGLNLDDPMFQNKFNRSVRDSRAIMVGAGNEDNSWRGSNFGSRLDVQAHGGNITTLGNGDLWGPVNGASVNQFYTAGFGGTSGASPIVASAVAVLQGYRKYLGRGVLDPVAMSNLLKSTGSPQTGDLSTRIGPKPNLRAAITATNNELIVRPIQGPTRIIAGQVCHYSESPSGGSPPYTKVWSWGVISGSVAGFTSNDQFTLVGQSTYGKAWLKVTVTDAAGTTKASAPDTVTVDPLGVNCY